MAKVSLDFIILGAQKAATSALQHALRKHPAVHMPKGESPFFEDPDYKDKAWINFGQEAKHKTLLGIKRPDNFCTESLINRISVALPEAKFVVVLREPVSRAVSSYLYLVRHAHLPALPLNEGMEACLRDFELNTHSRAAEVIRYGLYGRHLLKWRESYPAERFLILSQEQVVSAPADVLHALAQHLDLDPKPFFQTERKEEIGQANVGLYDPGALRIARFGAQLKTRPIPGTLRREPRAIVPRIAGTAITRFAEAWAQQKNQRRESLTQPIRARLETLYAEDLEELRPLVPGDTIYWDRDVA